MSFFDSFIGGAAEQGAAYVNDQIKEEAVLARQTAIAKINADLDEQKQKTKQALAAEMGQKISDGADQMNYGRIANSINQKNGSSMTADDAKDIAKNPEALKAYGIIDRSRAQAMDDSAIVAGKFGATDQMDKFRAQQQIEISRDQNERRLTAEEKRVAAVAEQNRIREKQVDSTTAAATERNEIAQRRVEALIAKQSGSGSGKGEKVMSILDGQRKEISAESGEISRSMNEELKNNKYGSPEEIQAIKDSYKPQLEAVAKKRKQLNADFAVVRDRFGLPGLIGEDGESSANPPKAQKPSPADKSPDKFIVGQQYKSNGITKTYAGNGVWK